MAGREDGVIDVLKMSLVKVAKELGMRDLSIPLSGLDRRLNADDFFALYTTLVLVESKSALDGLLREKRKIQACRLCQELNIDAAMAIFHERAHYTAWGTTLPPAKLEVAIDVYRHRICLPTVMVDCVALHNTSPKYSQKNILPDAFFRDIGESKIGLPVEDFIAYIKRLLHIWNGGGGGGGDVDLPIAIYGTSHHQLEAGITFENFAALEKWFGDGPSLDNDDTRGYGPSM